MVAALERSPPLSGSTVPIWELEFHIWEKFSGCRLTLGGEFEKLTAKERDMALNKNAEIFAEVSKQLHFAAITVPGGYWEIAPGKPAYFWLPETARYKQIKILRETAGSEFMLIAGASGVLAMPDASDYVEFSLKLFDAPEEIDLAARKLLDEGIETAKKLIDCGVEGLYTASDIADNRGPYYNPEQIERFVMPYLREWVSEVKKMGVYAILHSDGNLMACLDKIADSGIDALQSIDPLAGMDMRKVKAQTGGRLCLCGNVDCGLLIAGSAEQIFESTRDLLVTCKDEGGLVLGASNALQHEVAAENYLAMIDAWKEFGVY